MEISLLFIGDIVGRPGREAVAELLPNLKEKYQPDLIFANIENATHGRGVSKEHYHELKALGIDAFTSGDHIFALKEILPDLDRPEVMVLRPANYTDAKWLKDDGAEETVVVPGKGWLDLEVKGKRLRLINLLGSVFTTPNVANPFLEADKILREYPAPDLAVVDFHAEATSEKRCLAEYLDGRVQLVVGTHTHVPTADAKILSGGCAFISDLGMVGPEDSSLGAEKSPIIKSFLTGLPWAYSLSTGQCELGAVFCKIDASAGKATHIEHIRQFTRDL